MARKPTPTVNEAIELYMRRRGHLAKSSADNELSVLRRFAQAVGADRQLGYVTETNVTDYFAEIGDAQLPSSFNKVRQRVGLFLSYAMRVGWVKSDLMVDIRPRRVPKVERLRLSGPELMELLDLATDPRDRAFLVTAMNTATRASDIKLTTVSEVDLPNGEIAIFRPKTQQWDRLALTAQLDIELRAWLAEYSRRIGRPLRSDDLLFPTRFAPRGKPHDVLVLGALRPDTPIVHPARIVQRALTAFGVEVTRQEGVHTLRRSAARVYFDHASDKGYDRALRMTAALLGHKSTTTTELYLGLDADRRDRDKLMRGSDFLPVGKPAHVVQMRQRVNGRDESEKSSSRGGLYVIRERD